MNIVFCMGDQSVMKNYVSLLRSFVEERNIIAKISTYPDSSTMLFRTTNVEYQIDLIFLDVETVGFSIVEALREKKFYGEIIYLTQVKNQWDKAFDVEAFHYIIEKNCSNERFKEILGKAIQKIERKHEETLALSCAGKRVVIPIRDILYFEVKERWITAYYQEEKFEFFSRMGKIEETLVGKGFIRTHRSYLVAANYIASIRYNELILVNGARIPIGRGKYQEVRAQFERMEGGS